MTIETDSDRAVFINADEFGAAVIYTSILTGLPVEIQATWFDPSSSAAIHEVSTDTRREELTFREIDVPDPREGDTVRRASDGKEMQIATPINPDGEGLVSCTLVEIGNC